jgi:indole-3-glycerol phosphate synthase
MLNNILSHKRSEIQQLSLAEWKRRASDSPEPHGFLPLDTNRSARMARAHPMLIAEIKKASPSRGSLNESLDPIRVASIYAKNGASAISVLTDEKFFHGSPEILRQIAKLQSRPPLLRKDFILAPVQVYQSRALGADAMLLIVAALDDSHLTDLHALALSLGVIPLVEVHTNGELERALRVFGVRWIGVNNRDLATFLVRRETGWQLVPQIPASIGAVVESGITSSADARDSGAAGADAILVGEALITAHDMATKVKELAGQMDPTPPAPHGAG